VINQRHISSAGESAGYGGGGSDSARRANGKDLRPQGLTKFCQHALLHPRDTHVGWVVEHLGVLRSWAHPEPLISALSLEIRLRPGRVRNTDR